jgi:hypothetical protein
MLASAALAIPTNRLVRLRLLVVLLFVDASAQAVQLLIDFFALGVGQFAAVCAAVGGNFMPQLHFTRLQSRRFPRSQLAAGNSGPNAVLLIFQSSAHLRLWSRGRRLGVVLLIVNLRAEIVFLLVQFGLLTAGQTAAIFQPEGALFTF